MKTNNNHSDEFYEKLDNHELSDLNIYRLHYIDYYRIGETFGKTDNNIALMEWTSKKFMLPNEMNRKDAFKVISYLQMYVRNDLKLIPNSLNEVQYLVEVLELPRYGFKVIDDNNEIDTNELFIVNGRVKLFKENDLYNKYYKWFNADVKFSDVKKIYNDCNLEFTNPKYILDDKEKIVKDNIKEMRLINSVRRGRIPYRTIGEAKEILADIGALNLCGYRVDDYINGELDIDKLCENDVKIKCKKH